MILTDTEDPGSILKWGLIQSNYGEKLDLTYPLTGACKVDGIVLAVSQHGRALSAHYYPRMICTCGGAHD